MAASDSRVEIFQLQRVCSNSLKCTLVSMSPVAMFLVVWHPQAGRWLLPGCKEYGWVLSANILFRWTHYPPLPLCPHNMLSVLLPKSFGMQHEGISVSIHVVGDGQHVFPAAATTTMGAAALSSSSAATGTGMLGMLMLAGASTCC